MKSLSCARLLATPWTAAYQAPPFMGFSRQEYWSGVPLPPLVYVLIASIIFMTKNVLLLWTELVCTRTSHRPALPSLKPADSPLGLFWALQHTPFASTHRAQSCENFYHLSHLGGGPPLRVFRQPRRVVRGQVGHGVTSRH